MTGSKTSFAVSTCVCFLLAGSPSAQDPSRLDEDHAMAGARMGSSPTEYGDMKPRLIGSQAVDWFRESQEPVWEGIPLTGRIRFQLFEDKIISANLVARSPGDGERMLEILRSRYGPGEERSEASGASQLTQVRWMGESVEAVWEKRVDSAGESLISLRVKDRALVAAREAAQKNRISETIRKQREALERKRAQSGSGASSGGPGAQPIPGTEASGASPTRTP